MADYFSCKTLVCAPPVKRAAYSDRTAWIMAELSRLAYERLPGEVSIQDHITTLKEAVRAGRSDNDLEAMIQSSMAGSPKVTDTIISDELQKCNFTFLDSFSARGTEAFLAKLEENDGANGMVVLSFRGTQPDIIDILTDMKAYLVPAPSGGKVHSGFITAFQNVEMQIRASLEKHLGNLPLYITGHSLGGALALIATRYLGSDSNGATYTFGAPRTADDYFYTQIKTPIYRVVNAADGVARLPFGEGFNFLLALLRIIPINGTRWLSEKLRQNFGEYTHEGMLVFLSDAPNEPDNNGIPYKDLVVKVSPNYFWRSKIVVTRIITTRGRSAKEDHGITIYSKKLMAHALRRTTVGKLTM